MSYHKKLLALVCIILILVPILIIFVYKISLPCTPIFDKNISQTISENQQKDV